jgi:Tfp pilus assembly protein PilF
MSLTSDGQFHKSQLNHFFKEDLMDSTSSLLHSEFFTATGYFDRLLFALTDVSEFHFTPSGRDLFMNTFIKYESFFKNKLNFENEINNESQFKILTFKKNIRHFHQYIEKYLNLPFNNSKKWNMIVEYINLTYECAHEIHNYTLKHTQYDVQYPRMALIKERFFEKSEEDLNESKSFYIDFSDILEISKSNNQVDNNGINFLDLKREEKYDHFIHRGHLYMTEKNYESAKENFYKASNYIENAEVYTLLAWTYSFLDNIEKAKNYCLKAIKKDSQYGPAYNDYGNYLLNEGKIEESKRFFDMAKKALNYQNREYPYINKGRAFMMQNRFEEALKEFSYALILAPYHEELHNTVRKIKLNLIHENQPILKMENTENNHPS